MTIQVDVICAGIIVADHVSSPIPHLPAAGALVTAERILLTIGGCAANTAVDLRKMDVSVALAGRVGDDPMGHIVADMLGETGVGTSGIIFDAEAETSQTLIINVQGEDRRFIHTFGANGQFRAQDIPLNAVTSCKVLYVGGYLAMPALDQGELIAIFQAARQAGAKTVLDVVVPAPGDHLARLKEVLPYTDVFLPNDHESELITGERDPVRQAELFHRLGACTVVITMGGAGAILFNARRRLRSGVFPVPVVDASGGGDAFDAGFIYGLLHDMSDEDCLRFASALGASCVRAIGTTPGVFTRAECEAFLKENKLQIELT